MLVTILTVSVSAQSRQSFDPYANGRLPAPGSRLNPLGVVPYTGQYGRDFDQALGRAVAESMGRTGSGSGSMSSALPAPTPLPEKEPSISDAEKRKIYDEHLQQKQKIHANAKKFAPDRRTNYLWKSIRELISMLALKYHLTKPEIQWIVNHGAGIRSEDLGIRTALRGQKQVPGDEARRKEIFEDWVKQRDKSLRLSMKEKTQSRRKIFMKLEDQRLIKELTTKYHITLTELERITGLETTKNQ
jgi:hypothetical protein